MPINPVTGLEEDNEIETQTAVDPNIKEAPKSNDFGFSDDEIARLKKIRDKAG
ncbi:MAG: hypothetical protein GY827_04160 [Cytophagales bacterium]|nr:hypothetical protein [Cytophagales bacterium]